jgi:hypothetical protein
MNNIGTYFIERQTKKNSHIEQFLIIFLSIIISA